MATVLKYSYPSCLMIFQKGLASQQSSSRCNFVDHNHHIPSAHLIHLK